MGKHFWLIQRGSFRKPEEATEFLGSTSRHLINPDYMGAAEFEWGAVPKSCRRIMGQYEQYRLHITDLATVRDVPFCLFCHDGRYDQILNEIKAYLKNPYRTKERTDMEAHFTTECLFGDSICKPRLKTNFWWCIDKAQSDEDVGDWIAFIGASDRQNSFSRIINSEYADWWMQKPIETREFELSKALRLINLCYKKGFCYDSI